MASKASTSINTKDVPAETVVPTPQPVAPAPQPRPQVFGAIAAVATALCRLGIGKLQENKAQRFMFRGIDDILNELSPLFIVNHLVILPRYSERTQTDYVSQGGGRLVNVTLTGIYRLVSLVDGSFVEIGPIYGEAMDSADKATAKAMSVAFKYFAIQTFVIPIVGKDDADFDSHEPVAKKQQPVASAPQSTYPETETVEGAINRLAKTKPAREKLAALVAKAYGVVLPDQVPEDKLAEAIAKLEHYVEAQKTAAKKKAA